MADSPEEVPGEESSKPTFGLEEPDETGHTAEGDHHRTNSNHKVRHKRNFRYSTKQ